MSPGRLWLEFRRDLKRGPRAAWNHRVIAPRITRWRPQDGLPPAGPVPVHVVGGREHLLLGAWMLVSWFHHTGRKWQVTWHDDGTLGDDPVRSWMTDTLNVRFIPRIEADAHMRTHLAGHPELAAMRERLPLMLKLLDTTALAGSPRLLLIDPDVLFFQRPRELLDWVDEEGDDNGTCWFNREPGEPNYLDQDTVRNDLGFELWPCLNSGLGALVTDAVDFAFCERVMRDYEEMRGDKFWQNWRVEQTLMALCCSRRGRGGLLPTTYEVSLGRNRQPDAVSRHYIGAVRDLFWGEGVADLKTQFRLQRGVTENRR